MNPKEAPHCSSLSNVLREELARIRLDWTDLPKATSDAGHHPEDLRNLYAAIAKKAEKEGGKLSAICLSGGGIRSATFNLGILQVLARANLLHCLDYLSTVSGGGYVGSWLQAWIARQRAEKARPSTTQSGRPAAPLDAAEAKKAEQVHPAIDPLHIVMSQLSRPGRTPDEAASNGGIVEDPLAPEPMPIDRLREFSNYLTPRTGILSGDTWTLVAIVVRNLVLNWLVIVPVIAAALMVPQMAFLVAKSLAPRDAYQDESYAKILVVVALGVGFLSSVITHWLRAEKRSPPLPADPQKKRAERRRRHKGNWLALAAIILLIGSASLLVLAAVRVRDAWQMLPLFDTRAAFFSIWTIGLPVGGMLVAHALRWVTGRGNQAGAKTPGWPALIADLLAFIGAGLLASLLLAWLTGDPWKALREHSALLTMLSLPILLVIYVIARVLVTGFRSLFEDCGVDGPQGNESDREWWGRMTGRVLLFATGWLAVSGLVLFGSWLFEFGVPQVYRDVRGGITTLVAVLGAISGIATALLGKSPDTSSGHPGPAVSWGKELALKLAAPVAVISVTVLLAFGTAWLGRVISLHVGQGVSQSWTLPLSFLATSAGLLAIGFIAGCFVNVNRFSLHAMYRNRLVRAYLGASNIDRRPNPITGFDEEDGRLCLADLTPPSDQPAKLFPILNVTLNLLGGERLAWQERRAESFSMTPLYCGNFYEGYRKTKTYGGRNGGVSLATAMAISGAAANPNMGYVSSPALTFLMALLNARLGVWLPNTNESGGRKVDHAGPRHATIHLLREMFGLTTRYSAYVNLSDGGHFDNLGLYEVVLRRCRFVIVSDAGCDPEHGFGDLGNAIAKIRIDFGIPIEFEHEIEIRARDNYDRQTTVALYCAIGKIRYSVPDGVGASDGTLVYLKPTLAGQPKTTIPYDVQAYSHESPKFPHESTADQWFSERQFESYRALGVHLLETILGLKPIANLEELEKCMRQHVEAKAADASNKTTAPAVASGAI